MSQQPSIHRLSRRLLLGGIAAGAASAILAACGGSNTATDTPKPANATVGSSAAPTTASTAPTSAAASTGPSAAPATTGNTAPATAAAVLTSGKKNLIIGHFAEPDNLNPLLRSDVPGGLVLYNISEQLVWANYKTRQIEPGLATEWARVDPLTWRFKVRQGVQWHKGYGEFTAEDVDYTWNYALTNNTFQVGASLFPVAGVKAVDKYTVEVKLKLPFGAFPGVTMGYGGLMVSKKAHMELGDTGYAKTPIGTGPFVFDSRTSGSQLIVKKNTQYWQKDRPYLDEIAWRVIPDSHVRVQALQKGEIDFMTHPDAKDVKDVRQDKNLVYTSTPGWNWDYQQFTFPPFQQTSFPNQNKLVRQAISYAIDREAIAQQIYFGEATPTDNPIPPGFLGHQGSLLRYPKNSDLKKAKELMAQAGVKGYEVEVITSDKDWLRRETELVAAMVSQIGITYKIRGLDMGSYNNLWLKHNFQQNLEDISIVSPDPDSTVWWFLHNNGSVWAGYSPPELDKMLDDARGEDDPAKREPLYQAVVARDLEDSPYIYHLNVNYVRLYKKGLAGFEPSPQEYIERFGETRWEG